MELITVVNIIIGQPEWINDLTREMDKHLLYSFDIPHWNTYIYRHRNRKNALDIRYPGATRGHIVVNNNMIERIRFYNTADIYKPSVKEAVQKYIGAKLVFESEES